MDSKSSMTDSDGLVADKPKTERPSPSNAAEPGGRSGKKAYVCEQCDRVFYHQGNFNQHMSAKHGMGSSVKNSVRPQGPPPRVQVKRPVGRPKKQLLPPSEADNTTKPRVNQRQSSAPTSGHVVKSLEVVPKKPAAGKSYMCVVCWQCFDHRSQLRKHEAMHLEEVDGVVFADRFAQVMFRGGTANADSRTRHRLSQSNKGCSCHRKKCPRCRNCLEKCCQCKNSANIAATAVDQQGGTQVPYGFTELDAKYKPTNVEMYPWCCKLCQRTYPTEFRLVRHKCRSSPSRPYICQSHGCTKSFETVAQLHRHQQVHVDKPTAPWKEPPYSGSHTNKETAIKAFAKSFRERLQIPVPHSLGPSVWSTPVPTVGGTSRTEESRLSTTSDLGPAAPRPELAAASTIPQSSGASMPPAVPSGGVNVAAAPRETKPKSAVLDSDKMAFEAAAAIAFKMVLTPPAKAHEQPRELAERIPIALTPEAAVNVAAC